MQNCASIHWLKVSLVGHPCFVEAQYNLEINKGEVDQYIDGSSFPVLESHIL